MKDEGDDSQIVPEILYGTEFEDSDLHLSGKNWAEPVLETENCPESKQLQQLRRSQTGILSTMHWI